MASKRNCCGDLAGRDLRLSTESISTAAQQMRLSFDSSLSDGIHGVLLRFVLITRGAGC